jgi:hypothetical protein
LTKLRIRDILNTDQGHWPQSKKQERGHRPMNATTTITKQSTDTEIMAAYESLREQACGEAIGRSSDMTPAEAVEAEPGWTLLRAIHSGTNCPGTPVLARDAAGRLWVVNDLDGPWAIMVEAELTDEEACNEECVGCGGEARPCADCGYCSRQCRCVPDGGGD